MHIKPSYGLSPEEIERMLRESMENARKDIHERLLAEARLEAQRTIVELESAMKQDPMKQNSEISRSSTFMEPRCTGGAAACCPSRI